MELQRRITCEDYKAYYEVLWRHQKAAERSRYYFVLIWYLAFWGLATALAVKHDEMFATCVFLVLAGFYLKDNWSFAARWQERTEAYANMMCEAQSRLVIDETALTECSQEIQVQVPWSQIDDYTVHEDRLFIRFLKHRAFIIPFRHLTPDQRTELMAMLERHQVQKKSCPPRRPPSLPSFSSV